MDAPLIARRNKHNRVPSENSVTHSGLRVNGPLVLLPVVASKCEVSFASGATAGDCEIPCAEEINLMLSRLVEEPAVLPGISAIGLSAKVHARLEFNLAQYGVRAVVQRALVALRETLTAQECALLLNVLVCHHGALQDQQ